MTRRQWAGLVLWAALGPACLFRKKKDQGPRIYDVLGTIEEVSAGMVTVQTRAGRETFVMTASTVRGGDFKPGMYVHVYFTRQPAQNTATMVVEKVR